MDNSQPDNEIRIKTAAGRTVFAVMAIILFAVTAVCTPVAIIKRVGEDKGIFKTEQYGEPCEYVSLKNEYPFASSVNQTKGTLDKITDEVDDLEDTVKTYTADKNPLAPAYYYVYGAVNRLLGRKISEDAEKNVLCLEDGTLLFNENYVASEERLKNIFDFADWLKNRDTEFLYLLPGSKSDDGIIDYPYGFSTGYTETTGKLLKGFDKNGISYIDMKPILLANDSDYLSWFYKTDHHWKVQAGLLTAQTLCEKLRDTYGYDIDLSLLERDKYDSAVYEDFFLGSMGKKVTHGYIKPEDFEILIPKFETDFHLVKPSRSRQYNGSFEDTLLDKTHLSGDLYKSNPYAAFMHGDLDLINVTNNNCHNGLRVLVLKDSKSDIVTPYVACCVEQLDIIDPRHFPGSIRTYIEKTNPDIVIACATEPIYGNSTSWGLK